jgi:tRNA U34 2-thiouridine synthase MnmA/TrmU
MTKALGLFSGGLDSLLAARVLMEQGIEVTGISFETPFFGSGRARDAARQLGVPLIVADITEPHLAVMKHPRHGFGSNMNPCIDCHTLMVARASAVMREKTRPQLSAEGFPISGTVGQGFDFVFTGEVLNERPMSQNRNSLKIVETQSGCEGYLLRPLSAKLLDETIPEKEGKVDRSKLLDLRGRSRKPQMALAERYGITSYLQPAGGCLLTDPGFSSRLKELRDREGLDDVRALRLLKVGRHFRIESGKKIVVGRNEMENAKIEDLAREGDALLWPEAVPGPIVIIPGGSGGPDIEEAARACARYSDAREGDEVSITVSSGGKETALRVRRPTPADLRLTRIGI